MDILIQANDYACWKIIENKPIVPMKEKVTKPQDEWTIPNTKNVQNNAKLFIHYIGH